MTDISPTFGTPPTELIRRHVRPLAIFDRSLIVPAIWASFRKLDPRTLVKNPVMFCVEIVSVLTTIFFVRDLIAGAGTVVGTNAAVLGPDHGLAVVHRALRQFRGSGRGGARQGAGRYAAPDPNRDQGQASAGRQFAQLRAGRCDRAQAGRSRARRERRLDPERRRGDRRRRLGRRIGDHRRIGAGDPRERRRPLGGHRRHARHVRLAQGADHGGAGLDLSRPHDRARRRRGAAEDTERDRAQYPARRHDADLRLRHRHDPELCVLRRRRGIGRRPRRALRLPDPDDDRRPVVGDRHRRDGPARALQRARDVGPCGRGRGRCRHLAARQDRHDHARQSPGDRVSRPSRGRRGRARRRGAARLALRRDPGGPLDRRAGQGEIRAARARDGAARRQIRSVLGADADERHRRRRRFDPQGRGRRDRCVRRRRHHRAAVAQRCRGRAGGVARRARL